MATNASKYYATYMQSHTERFEKFRDEAYKELYEKAGEDRAYRKLLQQREKNLMDAAAKIRTAKLATDIPGLNLEIISLQLRANDQSISASEDAAKRALDIKKMAIDALTPTPRSNDAIAEMSASLATGGAVTADPRVVSQLVNGNIEAVASTIAPGSTKAAAAAQNTWKALSTSSTFAMLDPAAQNAAKEKIATDFGLDTVNIGGIAGVSLIDAPQDVLVQAETDKMLEQYAGAYGVGRAGNIFKELQDMKDALARGDVEAARKAATAAREKLAADAERELPKIRDELRAAPPGEFTETDVRELARQKYGPEAASMLRKQFERDSIGGDPVKLLHYDAIQAAKAGTIKPDEDSIAAAKQLLSLQPTLSKAEERQRAVDTAVQFATVDGKVDTALRDRFLIAYHNLKMNEKAAITEPSDILKEPERMADIEDVLNPRGITGIDPEARLAEAQRDFELGQRIADKMVALTNEQVRLEQSQAVVNDKDPAIAERLRRIREDKDRLLTLSREAEKAGRLVKDTPIGRSEMTDAALAAAATEREKALFPEMMARPKTSAAIKPRRQIGELPGMADLFKLDI